MLKELIKPVRPQLKNNKSTYGVIARAFHWVSAWAVIGLFFLGWWMVQLDYYDPWYTQGPYWHKGIGIFFAAWLLLRIVWKLINSKPDALGKSLIMHALVKLAHIILYGLLIIIVFTGFMIAASDSRSLDVLGLFSLPANWVIIDKQEILMGDWHRWLAYGLMALVALHVLAALKHHFINKDNTLRRMLGRVE